MKTINIIGSGIGGMAVAIRLAALGHKVNVFEKNAYPGGKLSELRLGAYRFDKGPSLFTLPELIDDLSEVAGVKKESFIYHKLTTLTHYFYEDGTKVIARTSATDLANELQLQLGENQKQVMAHLKKSAFYYSAVSNVFLNRSLHLVKSYFNLNTLRGLVLSPFLNLGSSMHRTNASRFVNEKTIQLFDRYATYNGSNPYKAPGLMNLIAHLEFNLGAYLPEKGMYQITEHLFELGKKLNVTFYFNTPVEKMVLVKNQVTGIESSGQFYPCDLVISDMDIHLLYKKLLPEIYAPKKILKQEKSSSAYVFYWAIQKEFKDLDLHNILFSNNYKEEFHYLFEKDEPYKDPTIYINITSKLVKEDAPTGCENWFVMINVPHNKKGKEIAYAGELRRNVINKINRMLQTKIENYIVQESILDPVGIELQTSSFGGSLYGNASNNRYAAFLRHSNYSSKIKGLYFVGGSVHPGGGIPLCLKSAKIVSQIIQQRYAA